MYRKTWKSKLSKIRRLWGLVAITVTHWHAEFCACWKNTNIIFFCHLFQFCSPWMQCPPGFLQFLFCDGQGSWPEHEWRRFCWLPDIAWKCHLGAIIYHSKPWDRHEWLVTTSNSLRKFWADSRNLSRKCNWCTSQWRDQIAPPKSSCLGSECHGRK